VIVVDTNILIHFWLPTDRNELIDELYIKDSIWIAPLLWKSEFRNVILLYLRKEIIHEAAAHSLMEKVETQMKGRELTVKSFDVISQALRSDCSAYDCEFITLATETETKLVTFDKKILRQYPNLGISPIDFVT